MGYTMASDLWVWLKLKVTTLHIVLAHVNELRSAMDGDAGNFGGDHEPQNKCRHVFQQGFYISPGLRR